MVFAVILLAIGAKTTTLISLAVIQQRLTEQAARIGAKATTLISLAEGGKGEALPTGAIASLGTSHFLHRGPIRDLEFFPDGSRLLSVAGDQVVAWDVKAARKDRAWKLDRPIRAGAVSSDGRRIAVADSGRLLHIFDASTGQRLPQLAGLADGANRVAFTPDGQRVIGGTQGEVLLWNAEDGEILRRWTVDGETIKTLQISPDGERFVIAVGDLPMRIHRIEGDDPPVELEGGPGFRAWAAFSPDGKIALTGQMDGTIALWDAASGEKIRAVGEHDGYIVAVWPLPDFRTAWWAAERRRIELRDLTTGEDLHVLEGPWSLFRGRLVPSPDGQWLAVGSRVVDAKTGEEIVVWEALTRQEIHKFDAGRVDAVAFSPDGTVLASAGYGETLVWDMTGCLEKGRLPSLKLRPEQLEAHWQTLGGEDGWADPEFDVRELAARELLDLGVELRPEVREALYRPDPPLIADPPFPARFDFRHPTPPRPRTPRPLLPLADRLRSSRAVAALELSGLPDAETLLDSLADGAPQAPLTREAIGSLERMRERK